MHSFYVWVILPCVYYNNFLIHLSVDGHLAFFHGLAVVNSAAVNIGVPVSFSIMVSSGYMPSSGNTRSYGGFILSFLRNLHTILNSGYTSLHSHHQCKRVPFSPPSATYIVCRLFDSSHSDQCEMLLHCGFDVHFSDNERCWASFHMFVSHLTVFFGEMSV